MSLSERPPFSRSNQRVSIKNRWTSTEMNQKSMKTNESMKINGNGGNSWSPNSLSFFLTSHLTCRKQLEYLCRRMSRENVSSDMWWLQAGSSRPVAYVVGGRVGMDETHQVKIHFNWDNLSLFSLLCSFSFLSSSKGKGKTSRSKKGKGKATAQRFSPRSH